MILTSRMIIRNAHSGAAGNQTVCAIAWLQTSRSVHPQFSLARAET
jgi:hypothetical protein